MVAPEARQVVRVPYAFRGDVDSLKLAPCWHAVLTFRLTLGE
jgi:hypothetical protein